MVAASLLRCHAMTDSRHAAGMNQQGRASAGQVTRRPSRSMPAGADPPIGCNIGLRWRFTRPTRTSPRSPSPSCPAGPCSGVPCAMGRPTTGCTSTWCRAQPRAGRHARLPGRPARRPGPEAQLRCPQAGDRCRRAGLRGDIHQGPSTTGSTGPWAGSACRAGAASTTRADRDSSRQRLLSREPPLAGFLRHAARLRTCRSGLPRCRHGAQPAGRHGTSPRGRRTATLRAVRPCRVAVVQKRSWTVMCCPSGQGATGSRPGQYDQSIQQVTASLPLSGLLLGAQLLIRRLKRARS